MLGGFVSNRKPFVLVALFLIIALIAIPIYFTPVDVLDNDADEFFLFELPPILEMRNRAAVARSQFEGVS